jgi:hypothetical protein
MCEPGGKQCTVVLDGRTGRQLRKVPGVPQNFVPGRRPGLMTDRQRQALRRPVRIRDAARGLAPLQDGERASAHAAQAPGSSQPIAVERMSVKRRRSPRSRYRPAYALQLNLPAHRACASNVSRSRESLTVFPSARTNDQLVPLSDADAVAGRSARSRGKEPSRHGGEPIAWLAR